MKHRMILGWVALTALPIAPSPLTAMTDLEMLSFATELGSVLASEETCGLSYDQDAIAAFIAQTGPADQMGFASQLNMATRGQALMIKDQSASARTAHCAAITATARHFGFIE